MSEARPPSFPQAPGEFFRRLCENAAVALVATDERFHIVSWNAAAEELLGIPAGRMLGEPLLQAVPEHRRNLLRKLLERTVRRGVTSQFEVRLDELGPRPRRDLTVVLSPVPDAAGRAQGVAAWVIDQTHRKRLAEQLAQAEKMASLGTLARGVSHHFNNILGGVATFVDYALTSGDPVSMKRALEMTAEAVARAAGITQSLRSFGKRDPHGTDLADLTEVALTFVHLVERPLAERNIKLQLDPHPVPIIPVDANRMHLVLGNLLTNAEEAMPDGGTICVSVSRAGEEVLITMADSGCGIPARHLPLVFEPFFTTKGLLAGGERANPGLGLSVVHGIITEMGGRVELSSAPGKGTTVVMRFPIPAHAKGTHLPAAEPAGSPEAGRQGP